METIRQLGEETQYIPPVFFWRSTAASNTRTIDSQVTLLPSCSKHGGVGVLESVPSTPLETFAFTKPKRKRHSRHFSNCSSRSSTPRHQRPRADSPVERPPTAPRLGISRSSTGPHEAGKIKVGDGEDGEEPHPSVPPDEPPKAIHQEPKASVSASTSASKSASASVLGSTSASKPARELNCEPTESQNSEPHRQRVRRTEKITQDGTDLRNTVVVGWVPTASGDQIVEAYIDRRLKYNLISQHLREQLGLTIKHHTGETVGQYNGKA
jgi:hypothetical protein